VVAAAQNNGLGTGKEWEAASARGWGWEGVQGGSREVHQGEEFLVH